MSAVTLPKAVADFVAATNAHDADGLFAVLADGAVVRDDGHTLTTEAEIRAWIRSHLVEPRIVISPTSFEGGRLIAVTDAAALEAPLTFAYDVVIDGDLISELAIDLA